jgi:hypothetical protein
VSDPQQETDSPQQALVEIRHQINKLTQEYSSGKLNAAQFNALYRHYAEKRTLIQKLLQQNPASTAWRAVVQQGHTTDLRDRYISRPLYYVVFQHEQHEPLAVEGKLPRKAAEEMYKQLQMFWSAEQRQEGVTSKSIGDALWMLAVSGAYSMTIAIYFLQPSTLQSDHLHELHNDFERANRHLLERRLPANRMVFPQRSLFQA